MVSKFYVFLTPLGTKRNLQSPFHGLKTTGSQKVNWVWGGKGVRKKHKDFEYYFPLLPSISLLTPPDDMYYVISNFWLKLFTNTTTVVRIIAYWLGNLKDVITKYLKNIEWRICRQTKLWTSETIVLSNLQQGCTQRK